jgi:hypothetical protein
VQEEPDGDCEVSRALGWNRTPRPGTVMNYTVWLVLGVLLRHRAKVGSMGTKPSHPSQEPHPLTGHLRQERVKTAGHGDRNASKVLAALRQGCTPLAVVVDRRKPVAGRGGRNAAGGYGVFPDVPIGTCI